MTRPGDPTLQSLWLFSLGLAFGDPDERKWLIDTFEVADLPACPIVRRLFIALRGGRQKAATLMELWGEPIAGEERAKEPMKRLLLRAVAAHAIEDMRLRRKTELLGVTSMTEIERIHAECDANDRARISKLADAEEKLRPKKEEAA